MLLFMPGIVSKESGKILSTTFSLRSEADYDDFTTFDFAETDKARMEVRMLIDEVKTFLITIPELSGYLINGYLPY